MTFDTVVIQSESPKAPEGHEQKMLDLVDNSAKASDPDPVDPSQTSDRPEWLPEKFQSPEDMAKAYRELESKLGAPKDAPNDDTKAENTPEIPNDPEKALSDKGLDLNDFSNEFAQKGELSPESYEKLQKAGFDKGLVDQFIEGQKARAVQFESAIKTEVGGDDRYDEMVSWAKANLTPGEIAAYNQAVSSGSADQAKLAALGLSAKFSKANGSEPQRMLGGQSKGMSEDVFESTAQLTEAMRDPRYKSDPAYRAKVTAKLSRSNVF